MDTNALSELITRKCQEELAKNKKYNREYKLRNSVRTAKRRKAIKGRIRLESEEIAENSANTISALNSTYFDEDEAYISGIEEARLETITKQAIKEWADASGLEVIIK